MCLYARVYPRFCLHVCLHVCTYVCVCIYICADICVHACLYVYVCACMTMRLCICVCVCTYVYVYVGMSANVCVWKHGYGWVYGYVVHVFASLCFPLVRSDRQRRAVLVATVKLTCIFCGSWTGNEATWFGRARSRVTPTLQPLLFFFFAFLGVSLEREQKYITFF